LPSDVTFEVSDDDKTWMTLQTVPITVDAGDMRTSVRDVQWSAKAPVTARYLRVVATRYGQQVNGIDTWVFSDEIIVK
jgi:hypothetical protein